jgi:hypothetical protein
MKLNLMLSQINHDIKLDNPKSTNVVKNEVMSDLKDNNIDKQLLRELKVSLYDDASLNSSEHTKTPINRSASNSDSRPSSATGSDDQFMDISPAEMISELVSELTDDGVVSKPVSKYNSIYSFHTNANSFVIPEGYENSSHSSANNWGDVVTNKVESELEAAPAIELEIVEQENAEDEEEEDNDNDDNIRIDEVIEENSGEQNVPLSENKKRRKKKKKKSIVSNENITM